MECNNHKPVKYRSVMALILLGLITFGLQYGSNYSMMTANVQGQEDSEDNSEDSVEDSDGATASTTLTEGTLSYIDPQGRFRIGIPADAIIMPLEEVPGGVVSISSPDFQNITSINLRISDLEDTDVELEEHVSSVLAGLKNSSIPNFKQIQDVECERFSLGGEQVCSIIYNGDVNNRNGLIVNNATLMQLYSRQDSSVYNIAYTAPSEDFSNNLRILEPVLDSFETLSGQEDLTPIPRFHNLTS